MKIREGLRDIEERKRGSEMEREQRIIGKGEERSKKSDGLMEGGIVRRAE